MVDGYNLSYLRPNASAAALSADAYQAPLVAFWHRGIGRVAAVTFPLAGIGNSQVQAWPDYAMFNQTLLRWLVGEVQVPGIGLRVRVDGGVLSLELLYTAAWETRLSASAPAVSIARGANGDVESLIWERMAPGRYTTSLPLADTTFVRGAVQIGDTVLPFGPIAAAVDPEWSFDQTRVAELKTVSQISGGNERLDFAGIWEMSQQAVLANWRPWLLWGFLLCFLAEALCTRPWALSEATGFAIR